jgi:hypothetical protein
MEGGRSKVGFGPMGQIQPSTQPSVSIIYMCTGMFIYSNSRGLYSRNSVLGLGLGKISIYKPSQTTVN